jgi:hypothetical protein
MGSTSVLHAGITEALDRIHGHAGETVEENLNTMCEVEVVVKFRRCAGAWNAIAKIERANRRFDVLRRGDLWRIRLSKKEMMSAQRQRSPRKVQTRWLS